jgi:ABC-type Fe3+/spermidine/putrescine transport system ATPase subunit
VALARVLVVRPDALLLDEPLSNLDAKLRVEMRDEIRRVHRETGITFVYVTHDQKEALSMADRIALMNEGKIVQVGTPHEIYSSPKCRFAATFLGRMNLIMGEVVRVTAEDVVVGTAVGGIRAVKPEGEFTQGEAVECLVRPEAMRIASDDQPAGSEENVLKGTVVDHSYLGETSEFQVKLKDGTNARVYVASSHAERIKKGEEVDVVFAPKDVVLCRTSSASSGANAQSGAVSSP